MKQQSTILNILPSDWIKPPFEQERLPGDGGHRIYTRVKKDGESRLSVFCGTDDPGLRDFVKISRLLKEAGVRVPAVYKADQKRGLVLIEDLGDVSLQRIVKERGAPGAWSLYCKAVEALVRLQKRVPTEGLPRFEKDFFLQETVTAFKNMEALRRAEPAARLFGLDSKPAGEDRGREAAEKDAARPPSAAAPRKEKGPFANDGGGGSAGLSRSAAAEKAPPGFLRDMSRIASQLKKEPYVFCHRDFHSRNLMAIQGKTGEELALIDFQDAGYGPFCYDLTSLFYDSYVFLDEGMQRDLLAFYQFNLSGALRRETESLDKTEHVVRLQFLQRGFKACGCFAGFYVNGGRASHLPFLPETLRRLEEEADRLSFKHIKSRVRFFRRSLFSNKTNH